MFKSKSDKLVEQIMQSKNVDAQKTLEDIVREKCAQKIAAVLNPHKVK